MSLVDKLRGILGKQSTERYDQSYVPAEEVWPILSKIESYVTSEVRGEINKVGIGKKFSMFKHVKSDLEPRLTEIAKIIVDLKLEKCYLPDITRKLNHYAADIVGRPVIGVDGINDYIVNQLDQIIKLVNQAYKYRKI